MEQLATHWTDSNDNLCWGLLLKSVGKKFGYSRTKIYGTFHEDLSTFCVAVCKVCSWTVQKTAHCLWFSWQHLRYSPVVLLELRSKIAQLMLALRNIYLVLIPSSLHAHEPWALVFCPWFILLPTWRKHACMCSVTSVPSTDGVQHSALIGLMMILLWIRI